METWESRGHNRKPNAIVRGIYWVADWLGDFGYLWASTKRASGHFALVSVNLIILLSILITSAAHSLQLLRYAGAKGGLEFFLLVAWEAMFITSSILLDRAFKQGKYFSPALWLPFLTGLVFVEASNILGMAGNLAGLLIGSFTPILLLFSKFMLMWQMKNGNIQIKKQPSKTVEKSLEEKQIKEKKQSKKQSNGWLNFFRKKQQKSIENPKEKTEEKPENESEKSVELDGQKSNENAGENEVEKTGDKNLQTPDVTSGLTTKNLAKNEEKKAAETVDEKPVKKDTKTRAKTPKKKTTKKKKSAKKNREKILAKAIEIALSIEELEGELPSQNQLAVLAKTSKYYAGKALDEIKAMRKQQEAIERQQEQDEQRQAS